MSILTNISILALAGTFIFTTMAIRNINSTIGHLLKQDASLVKFDTYTNRIKRLEARELDLSFAGREDLLTGLTYVRYFDRIRKQIYNETGYGMITPEYQAMDEEGHVDWDRLNVYLVLNIDDKNEISGYRAEYVTCRLNDDGVGSRNWSSMADEIRDGVINCRDGYDSSTGALRPNLEFVVNRIIRNTKFEW